MEQFSKVTEELGVAEGEFKKLDKLEKPTLAVLQTASDEKSQSSKERDAYAHGRYMEWVFKYSDAQKKFLNIRAKRDGLDMRIKGTISALAYDRTMIELAK